MAYVAVDKDGRELKCSGLPHRDKTETIWLFGKDCLDVKVLECGEIEKLIGRKLTWEDEPVELSECLQDEAIPVSSGKGAKPALSVRTCG